MGTALIRVKRSQIWIGSDAQVFRPFCHVSTLFVLQVYDAIV